MIKALGPVSVIDSGGLSVQFVQYKCSDLLAGENLTEQMSTEKMPVVFRDGIVCSQFKNQPVILLLCSTNTEINPWAF